MVSSLFSKFFFHNIPNRFNTRKSQFYSTIIHSQYFIQIFNKYLIQLFYVSLQAVPESYEHGQNIFSITGNVFCIKKAFSFPANNPITIVLHLPYRFFFFSTISLYFSACELIGIIQYNFGFFLS